MAEKLVATYLMLVLSVFLGVQVYGIGLKSIDDHVDASDPDAEWETILITQSWSQQTNWTRTVPYKVYGKGGPIIIALGGAYEEIAGMHEVIDDIVLPNGGNFVLFMPEAYLGKWNAIGETSQAPDVEFMEEIADAAANMTDVCNISMGVGLIGFSSGCGMMLRVVIESQKPELQRFICYSSEITTVQYNNGKFFAKDEPENEHEFSKDLFKEFEPLASGRTLWLVHGTEDDHIPTEGGHYDLPDDVDFIGLNETGLAFSSLYGCEGDVVVKSGDDDVPGWNYHTCHKNPTAVKWWNVEGAPHSMVGHPEYGFWNGPNAYVSTLAAKLLSMCDGCEDPLPASTSQELHRQRSKSGLRLRRSRSLSVS